MMSYEYLLRATPTICILIEVHELLYGIMTRFLQQVILAALLLPAMVAANCTTESLTQDLMTLVESSFVSSALQGHEVDSLQINDQRIVCLSTGTIRGTYSSASVLVDIICNGSACPSSGK